MDYKNLKLSDVNDMTDKLINRLIDAREGLNRTYLKSAHVEEIFETGNITVSKYVIEVIKVNT